MKADLSKLPELCMSVLPTTGQLIGIKRGETGYYQMYDGTVTGEGAKMYADRFNKATEVTPQQRSAMENGSLFGWDTPASDPDNEFNKDATHYFK